MKKKLLSILVAIFVLISSTNAFAASAWLQDSESATDGYVETEVLASAINGSVVLSAGVQPTGVNSDAVEFTFSADAGHKLATFDTENDPKYIAIDPLLADYHVNAQMKTEWSEWDVSDDVLPNLDNYYDLIVTKVGGNDFDELILSVNVVRNDLSFPSGTVKANLEPELFVTIEVGFEAIEYIVSAKSLPADVAIFSGTGLTFTWGQDYDVAYEIVNNNYEFVRWSELPSGNISGDVHLIAEFKEKQEVNKFSVSAVSNPKGIASFQGTGTEFLLGEEYEVEYTLLDDDYQFLKWEGENKGFIEEDVNLVAVFELKEIIQEIEYKVSAESSPEGIATFYGTGESFSGGDEYDVTYKLLNTDYKFEGWIGVPSGIIESDVNLVAVFKKNDIKIPVYYYEVTATSNPVGVASFSGLGDKFSYGNKYNVSYTLDNDAYVFVGWSNEPSGTITNDIALVANFELVNKPTYIVSAISSPANVATFDGTANDLEDGSSYDISVSSVLEGYTFERWDTLPTGVIDSADVKVVAVFTIVEAVLLDEAVAEGVVEELADEILPEAGGIPTIAFGFIGLIATIFGVKLRK